MSNEHSQQTQKALRSELLLRRAGIVAGAFAASLSALGYLCKHMHWEGADILLTTGLTIFSLVFVPIAAKYQYDQVK